MVDGQDPTSPSISGGEGLFNHINGFLETNAQQGSIEKQEESTYLLRSGDIVKLDIVKLENLEDSLQITIDSTNNGGFSVIYGFDPTIFFLEAQWSMVGLKLNKDSEMLDLVGVKKFMKEQEPLLFSNFPLFKPSSTIKEDEKVIFSGKDGEEYSIGVYYFTEVLLKLIYKSAIISRPMFIISK